MTRPSKPNGPGSSHRFCGACERHLYRNRAEPLCCAVRVQQCSKSKWGRHHCRPHSHQRVGALVLQSVWRTIRFALPHARLALRCLPASSCSFCRVPLAVLRAFQCRFASRFVTGARTGIRLSFVTISPGFRPKPSSALTAPCHSRDHAFAVIDGSNTPVPGPRTFS